MVFFVAETDFESSVFEKVRLLLVWNLLFLENAVNAKMKERMHFIKIAY
jgi:hypothetical protein